MLPQQSCPEESQVALGLSDDNHTKVDTIQETVQKVIRDVAALQTRCGAAARPAVDHFRTDERLEQQQDDIKAIVKDACARELKQLAFLVVSPIAAACGACATRSFAGYLPAVVLPCLLAVYLQRQYCRYV